MTVLMMMTMIEVMMMSMAAMTMMVVIVMMMMMMIVMMMLMMVMLMMVMMTVIMLKRLNLHHEIGEAVDDGDALGAFYRLRICIHHSKCLHNPLHPW